MRADHIVVIYRTAAIRPVDTGVIVIVAELAVVNFVCSSTAAIRECAPRAVFAKAIVSRDDAVTHYHLYARRQVASPSMKLSSRNRCSATKSRWLLKQAVAKISIRPGPEMDKSVAENIIIHDVRIEHAPICEKTPI
jgi:hypothetical protein